MRTCALMGLLLALGLGLAALPGNAGDKKTTGVWTNPKDEALPPDYKVQGEYEGTLGSEKLGAQVIALGKGRFQAVLLPGGLPGAGWDGKNKILLDGTLEGTTAAFKPAMGDRKYLAASPDAFSAAGKFPPPGQKDCTAAIAGEKLTGKTDDGKEFSLSRVVRTSPTLGAKAPAGAVILFDGSNADEWSRGRVDNGILNTDGQDLLTKRKFNNYTAHVEFMLPFRPNERGQARGNSGFYQVHHYELQILDSFGLEGRNNECGGFYTLAEPKVNMCLPPLQWQTYDIEFTNAVRDAEGKRVKPAVVTVRHNGVAIHENLELKGKTGGSRGDPEGTPGPLLLQGHGNPLQYRNIWVVEKK